MKSFSLQSELGKSYIKGIPYLRCLTN